MLFDPGVFLEHLEVLTAGGLGLALLLVYRRPVVFLVVLLLTALVAHGAHHSYWFYYYCTLCGAFELDFGSGSGCVVVEVAFC